MTIEDVWVRGPANGLPICPSVRLSIGLPGTLGCIVVTKSMDFFPYSSIYLYLSYAADSVHLIGSTSNTKLKRKEKI